MKRHAQNQVKFRQKFIIPGLEGSQPPGTYSITTVEEGLEMMASTAWHRTATYIRTPDVNTPSLQFQDTMINPEHLLAALAADTCELELVSEARS